MKSENWFTRKILSPAIFLSHFIKDLGGFTVFFKKIAEVIRKGGIKTFVNKSRHIIYHSRKTGKSNQNLRNYNKWLKVHHNILHRDHGSYLNAIESFEEKPKISIILPVENVSVTWLKEAIQSVEKQVYTTWELCITFHASPHKSTIDSLQEFAEQNSQIRIIWHENEGGSSSSFCKALELATGEWIAIFKQTDLLSKDALFWIVKFINQNKKGKLFYSDEDCIEPNGIRKNPYFKCNWNYHLFLSHNMIGNLAVYHAISLKKVLSINTLEKSVWEYDLALRFIEHISADDIIHIPRILYHKRTFKPSKSQETQKIAQVHRHTEKVINNHLIRTNVKGRAVVQPSGRCRLEYNIGSQKPLVSIIIPTRNNQLILQNCINSIFDKTDYPNYEIVIVDNNSDETETLRHLDLLRENNRVKVLNYMSDFNYSAINNKAVKSAEGRYICFLNDDTEVITPTWLSEMLSICCQPNVGVVGARLWYPNNTLQHGGVILGVSGIASHAHKFLPKAKEGYHGRAELIQEFSAVTAACMLIPKSLFVEIGGFNETQLAVAYNDVDLCLKIKKKGYSIVWTPYAELYHHESISRGEDIKFEKKQRLQKEAEYMINKWGGLIKNDPAYSPNLTSDREDFSLAWPPRFDK